MVRDEGGADVVAVGQGGQALDVDAEQAGERLGLGLAELGELGRDVLHRAVALAELDAGERPAPAVPRAGRRSVAVVVERVDEGRGAGGGVVARGVDAVGVALLERARRGARRTGARHRRRRCR